MYDLATDTYNPPISFRASEMTMQQLDDLKKRCGENRSKVIARCIERFWVQEFGPDLLEDQSKERQLA